MEKSLNTSPSEPMPAKTATKTIVKDQVRLTPEQIRELRVLAASRGLMLKDVHAEFVQKLVAEREKELEEGRVRSDLRYAATLAGAKTHNMVLPEPLTEAVSELAERDNTTAPKILYTAVVQGLEDARAEAAAAAAKAAAATARSSGKTGSSSRR
jgi:hypothetical protein